MRRCGPFAGLRPAGRDDRAAQRLHAAGQCIYLPGDPSDDIFLLKAGVVRIAVIGPEGREAILGFLQPGDLFGELALVEEGPRNHVSRAQEDAVICAFDREVFVRFLQDVPGLGYQITKMVGSRLRRFHRRVEELLYKSAHARVAHALLDLSREHGIADADGILIPIRLSQRDIGNLVGLTRETVNTVFQDFRQRGLLAREGLRLRLKDPCALARLI